VVVALERILELAKPQMHFSMQSPPLQASVVDAGLEEHGKKAKRGVKIVLGWLAYVPTMLETFFPFCNLFGYLFLQNKSYKRSRFLLFPMSKKGKFDPLTFAMAVIFVLLIIWFIMRVMGN